MHKRSRVQTRTISRATLTRSLEWLSVPGSVFGFFLVCLTITLGFATVAWGQPADKALARAQRITEAEQLTAELIGPNEAAARNLKVLVARASRPKAIIAQQRKAALLALIEEDPGEVLHLALPAAMRKTLPADVQPYLERELTVEGHLETSIVGDPDGALHFYRLLGADGISRRLHFIGHPPSLAIGSQILIRGITLNEEVALRAGLIGSTATGLSILSTAPI